MLNKPFMIFGEIKKIVSIKIHIALCFSKDQIGNVITTQRTQYLLI